MVNGYHIGTHFWIDRNGNGIYDGESIDEPVPGARVELFDSNGVKVAETTTDIHGEYGFDVDAGSYYVVFTVPRNLQNDGYGFVQQGVNEDNNINRSVVNSIGRTGVITVGTNVRREDLTRDAALYCACANVESDSIDALNAIGLLGMIFILLFSGLSFVQRDIFSVLKEEKI
jgi:hypothetical protein